MTTTPDLHIMTGRESEPIGGMDTAIATMPPEFYVEVDGAPTLLIQPFMKMLSALSEKLAGDINETLHHAEWVITTDPAIVQSKGAMHDCEHCKAGVRRALRSLRDDPDQKLLVGALYWVQP